MKTIWTAIKFILIWLLVGLIILAGAFFILDDLLMGFKILAIVFVVWLVLYIIYRIVKRIMAKRRVSQLVSIERGASGTEEEEESWFPFQDFFTEDRTIYKRVNQIIRFLRTSKLSVLSSSIVYVKPWFLVMGESDKQKTELLEKSDLNFPVAGQDSLKSEDGSIDFYLTNGAIYINTSNSLYPGHGERIPAQLTQLLKALYFNRAKEPVNSIVLTLDAEQLLDQGADELERVAKRQRFYFTFFMLYLRVRLPVHVVVTNTEALEGFDQWSDLLAEEELHRPLGEVNTTNDDWSTFSQAALDNTCKHIDRLMLLALSVKKGVGSKALLLSANLASLSQPLHHYFSILFASNEYQDLPHLSGLFFVGSSKAMGVSPEEEDDEEEGLSQGPKMVRFAKILLEEILPADRDHIHDLEHYRRRKISLPTAYFVGISLALVTGFVWASWFFSLSTAALLPDYYSDYEGRIQTGEILSYNTEKDTPAPLTDAMDLVRSAVTMDYVRRLVIAVEDLWDGWILPWTTFIDDSNVVEKLKSSYYSYVSAKMVARLDRSLQLHIKEDFSASSKLRLSQEELDAQVAEYAKLLYQRIFILNQYKNGATFNEVRAMDPPFVASPLYFRDAVGVTEDNVQQINDAYLQSIYWSESKEEGPNPRVEGEIKVLNRMLAKVLKQGDVNFNWVIGWANQTLRLSSFNIADSFLGSGKVDPPLIVGGAFTKDGNRLIDDFIVRMLALYPPNDTVYNRIVDLRSFYMQRYQEAWEKYANGATRGLEQLSGRTEWFSAIQQLSGKQNPYFSILNDLYEQNVVFLGEGLLPLSRRKIIENKLIADVKSGGLVPDLEEIENQVDEATSEPEVVAPEWLDLLSYYQQVKALGKEDVDGKQNPLANKQVQKLAIKMLGKAGAVGKTLSKSAKKAQKTHKKMSKGKKGSTAKTEDELRKKLEQAAADLDSYVMALSDLAFQANARDAMFKEIKGVFENAAEPSKASGSLGKLHSAFKKLQFSMGIESDLNKPFWSLLAGSIETLHRFAVNEAAEEAQMLWEKKVLAQTQDLKGDKFTKIMFDPTSGLLWKFVKEEIEPFIDTTVSGTVVPRKLQDGSFLPFSKEFVHYLTQATMGLSDSQPSYSVVLNGSPTTVNSGGLFKPTRTILSMDCPDKSYNLVNLNFNTRDVITWTPDCGDLTLSVDFTVFTATKIYPAPAGFASFLSSLEGGVANYKASDFPEAVGNLRDINVTEITLRYLAEGGDDVIRALNIYPTLNPQIIAEGWPN